LGHEGDHPHAVARLRMSIATCLLPLQAFMASTGTTSSFYYAAGLKR